MRELIEVAGQEFELRVSAYGFRPMRYYAEVFEVGELAAPNRTLAVLRYNGLTAGELYEDATLAKLHGQAMVHRLARTVEVVA